MGWGEPGGRGSGAPRGTDWQHHCEASRAAPSRDHLSRPSLYLHLSSPHQAGGPAGPCSGGIWAQHLTQKRTWSRGSGGADRPGFLARCPQSCHGAGMTARPSTGSTVDENLGQVVLAHSRGVRACVSMYTYVYMGSAPQG